MESDLEQPPLPDRQPPYSTSSWMTSAHHTEPEYLNPSQVSDNISLRSTMGLLTTSTSFHKFKDLPFELRRQVWTIGLEEQLDRIYQLVLEESDEDEAPYLCLDVLLPSHDQTQVRGLILVGFLQD